MRIRFLGLTSPVITIFCVFVIVFLAIRLVPGNPAQMLLGEMASSESIQTLEKQLGLDRTPTQQLTDYLRNISHGSLGDSVAHRKPVAKLLGSALPYSILLTLAAGVLCWWLGTRLAFFIIRLEHLPRAQRYAQFVFHVVFFLASIPSFLMAPALAILVTRCPWLKFFSISGFDGIRALPIAALSLSLSSACSFALTARTFLLDELKLPYAQYARAKGLSFKALLHTHLWPVARTSIAAQFLLFLTHLFSGAILVESFFDWPGMGTLLVNAIMARDYPVVQSTVLVTAIVVVAANFLGDHWLKKKSEQLK